MSMMQKSPRPLSASLLAPKGAARPAAPLEESAAEHLAAQPAAHHLADAPHTPPHTAENAAFSSALPPSQTPGAHGEPRTLFDVPPAPKLTPKFGKKQASLTETPAPETKALETKEPETLAAETAQQQVTSPHAKNTPADPAPPRQEAAAPNRVEQKVADPKKAAFTFRMCEARHFRLRLLSAHQNRSSQKILEDALDTYLAAHAPQTAGLACQCFDSAGGS